MVSFIADKEYDEATLTQIIKEISSVAVKLREEYLVLDDIEKSKITSLNISDKNLLNLLVANQYSLLNEANRIKQTKTYRLGSLIVWFPRKVKDFYTRYIKR